MKLKLISFFKRALILGIISVLSAEPGICLAAKAENQPDVVVSLKKDTVFVGDLNGDGKADKVYYKVTENEDDFTATLKLYINDKLCLTKTDHGFLYTLQICDLDKSDKYLDLYGCCIMESDCINDSFFVRYNGKELVSCKKFQPEKIRKYFNSVRYSLDSVDGNGKFNVITDTPIYSDAIGCYYCYVPYQYKDNKISLVSVKTYLLAKDSREYEYIARKSFSVYEKAGSKAVVYKVAKGDKVTFDKLYVSKKGNAYFRAISSSGKKGWIKSSQEGLFSNVPAWG